MLVATALGAWGFAAAVFGLALAWAYSAPPFRLKRNGWWGNAAVGLCYEGLPWFTGAAVMAAALPDWRVIVLALLYSIGAHGIMTLNDFKSVEGDTRMGIGSLPVRLGVDNAARLACAVMAVPQVIVIAFLFTWGNRIHAGIVAVLLIVQLELMVRLLRSPRERATWYSATGVTLYVLGMLVSAFALLSNGCSGINESPFPVMVSDLSGLAWFKPRWALSSCSQHRRSTASWWLNCALPAMLPGALVALHYAMQILRPRLGHGSDCGGRRTPWIIGGMAVLALGGLGAAAGTAWMRKIRGRVSPSPCCPS